MSTYQPAQTWPEEDAIDAAMIEQYKAWWRKHGFPDVDLQNGSHVHTACLNDPTWRSIPEQELWGAVVREAWYDLWPRGKHTKRKLTDKRDAAEWFASASFEQGSLRWICSFLSWDIDYVRRVVAEQEPQPQSRGGQASWQVSKKLAVGVKA